MELIPIDRDLLFLHVGIVAVSTIGITQWMKNFFRCDDNGYCKYKRRMVYAATSFIVCMLMAIVQSPIINPDWTLILTLGFLGLAICQMAHDYIIKGVQNMVERVLSGHTEKRDKRE